MSDQPDVSHETKPVDNRGIPIYDRTLNAAPFCPEKPCELCTGSSELRRKDGTRLSSWEWCQLLKTCAATVDWERIYGHE